MADSITLGWSDRERIGKTIGTEIPGGWGYNAYSRGVRGVTDTITGRTQLGSEYGYGDDIQDTIDQRGAFSAVNSPLSKGRTSVDQLGRSVFSNQVKAALDDQIMGLAVLGQIAFNPSIDYANVPNVLSSDDSSRATKRGVAGLSEQGNMTTVGGSASSQHTYGFRPGSTSTMADLLSAPGAISIDPGMLSAIRQANPDTAAKWDRVASYENPVTGLSALANQTQDPSIQQWAASWTQQIGLPTAGAPVFSQVDPNFGYTSPKQETALRNIQENMDARGLPFAGTPAQRAIASSIFDPAPFSSLPAISQMDALGRMQWTDASTFKPEDFSAVTAPAWDGVSDPWGSMMPSLASGQITSQDLADLAPTGANYGDLGFRDTTIEGYPTVAQDQATERPYPTVTQDQTGAPIGISPSYPGWAPERWNTLPESTNVEDRRTGEDTVNNAFGFDIGGWKDWRTPANAEAYAHPISVGEGVPTDVGAIPGIGEMLAGTYTAGPFDFASADRVAPEDTTFNSSSWAGDRFDLNRDNPLNGELGPFGSLSYPMGAAGAFQFGANLSTTPMADEGSFSLAPSWSGLNPSVSTEGTDVSASSRPDQPGYFSGLQTMPMGSFQDYSATPPGFGLGFAPSFDTSVNTGWAQDKDTSPAPQAARHDYGLTGLRANDLSYPDASTMGPTSTLGVKSYTPTYDGSVPAAPTANEYGLPSTSFKPAQTIDDLGISLPPEVPAPTFDLATPAMPTPVARPQTQQVAAPRAPTAVAAPRSIAAPRAPSFSAAPSTTAEDTTPAYSPPDFGAAFNGLSVGPQGAQNRASFASMTGLTPTTVDSLVNQYAAAGPLTAVAYGALQDAFNNPKATTVAKAPDVTSSTIPDLNPTITGWGQANGVTGNWDTDTSMKAVNDRIAGYGSMTIDPVTGQMMSTADDSSGWGLGGLFSGLGSLFGGGWGGGGGGMNTGENDPRGPTGGLW